jgi:hypothetical protein
MRWISHSTFLFGTHPEIDPDPSQILFMSVEQWSGWTIIRDSQESRLNCFPQPSLNNNNNKADEMLYM